MDPACEDNLAPALALLCFLERSLLPSAIMSSTEANPVDINPKQPWERVIVLGALFALPPNNV